MEIILYLILYLFVPPLIIFILMYSDPEYMESVIFPYLFPGMNILLLVVLFMVVSRTVKSRGECFLSHNYVVENSIGGVAGGCWIYKCKKCKDSKSVNWSAI